MHMLKTFQVFTVIVQKILAKFIPYPLIQRRAYYVAVLALSFSSHQDDDE